MSAAFNEMLKRFSGLPEDLKKTAFADAVEATKAEKWVALPGPQTDAYFSEADILLYGGQAGGGKTHFELGWGVNEAQSGIIFRREGTQTDGLEKEGKLIIGEDAKYNGTDMEWTWASGKSLKLAGMPQPEDWGKHAGRERDYYAFDEAGEFLEQQVASIIAWLRAPEGRRTRIVLGSNPPRTTDGLWMVKWFAPWLDDTFPNPAVPGELRWAYRVTTQDEILIKWVEGPGIYTFDGEEYIAQSYTFIPASLEDNPYRNNPKYRATLQSLPEPLRSQLLYGKFTTMFKDAENQIIPTDWVRQAFDRWTPEMPTDVPMCAIGVDMTGGGEDPFVMAPRYDGWFAPMIKVPAKDFDKLRIGSQAAGHVVSHRRHDAVITIDMGGGYGSALYEKLDENKIKVESFVGSEKCPLKAKGSRLGFANTRTAAYWRFRESLDPDQPGGSTIAMCKDNRLLAGLTAVTFEVRNGVIHAEPKVTRDKKGKVNGGVKHKLGFSPDEADATVMSWFNGEKMSTAALDWINDRTLKTSYTKHQPLSVRPRPLSTRMRMQ